MKRLSAILFALSLLSACAPGREVEVPRVCSPGSSTSCGCDSGEGIATCLDDGSRFGSCVCSAAHCDGGSCEADAGPTDGGHLLCQPGSEVACTCPDNRNGQQRCNGSGTAYVGSCVCDSPQVCSASSLVATGSVTFSGGGAINYSGTQVVSSFTHALGPGTETGCLGTSHLELALQGDTCHLSLDFGPVEAGFGGLTQVTLSADSDCASLVGISPGTYTGTAGYGLISVNPSIPVPNRYSADFCIQSEFLSFSSGSFTLTTSGGTTLTISLGTLILTGDLFTQGSAGDSCFSASMCAPEFAPVGPAWCRVFSCEPGQHDGGDRMCVPNGTCSFGYHDGGDGKCLALGTCTVGYHDGGDGSCVAEGCAVGYHNGGHGNCVEVGVCDFGYHDGGDGSCAANGTCASGYSPDAHDTCIPSGSCSAVPSVARPGADQSVAVGTTVTLDGSGSTGAPALTYEWQLLQLPASSIAFLSSNAASVTTLVPDKSGDYIVSLRVTDGRGCQSATATVTVHVADQRASIKVKVTWDSDHGDVDLHYLAPGGTFKTAPLDCYWGNTNPPWPTTSDTNAANDPLFLGDARWGGATGETTQQDELYDGVFTPEVHYYCARQSSGGASTGAVSATIHVLKNGTEVFSQTRTLNQGDVWPAAAITVSGGGTHVEVGQSNLSTFTSAACQ